MTTLSKAVNVKNKIEAITALRKTLMSIDASIKPTYKLAVGDVAAILDVDAHTLRDARVERERKLKKREEINPLSLESISFIHKPPTAVYTAQEIENYFKRLELADKLPPWQQSRAENYPNLNLPYEVRGFQTWLAQTGPTETWPFSIQDDGRPIDMVMALVDGKLTGNVEWLTLREFGTRAADAASSAFHNAEDSVIGEGARVLDEPTEPRGPRTTGL